MPTAANLASQTICWIHLLSIVSSVMSQIFAEDNMLLSCSESNNTASNTFTSNLDNLFNQKLHSEAGKSLYYNASEGEYPDTVYGLYLCKFNVSFQSCQNCIVAAVNSALQKCNGTKEAFIWNQVEECMVRFSDRSLSIMDTSAPMCLKIFQNMSVPDNVTKSLAQSFSDVIAMPSLSSFRNTTTGTNISSYNRLETFGQCIPVLSVDDCRDCLNNTISWIQRCFVPPGTGLGRIIFPSCIMGFELYPHSKVPAVGALPPSSAPGGKRRRAIIIAIGTTLSAIIVVLFGWFLWYRSRRYERDQEEKTNSQEFQLLHWEGRIGHDYSYDILRGGKKQEESQEFPLLPLGLALEATNHFSDENKLGQGGFGPVYKGTLADGKAIAVKRLSRTSGQGLQEFKNEVNLIAKLQHKNLVRLLGCCLEGQELLLVYEYMPNKSLDVHLFDATRNVQLDWKRRISIINGIARGLLYLHEDSRLRIVHRDLKASNVLLDHDMNPKISDFGIARIFGGNQNEANTNTIAGTYGYMAPEYAMAGLFSIKSDVFSFGVLLLEVISGRKNNGFYFSEHGESLLTRTWKLWCEGHAVELMDLVLKQSCVPDELLKFIHIGLLCVQEDPADRPTMSSVVVMLAGDSVTLPQPTQPAYSVGPVVVKSSEVLPSAKDCSVSNVTVSDVLPR